MLLLLHRHVGITCMHVSMFFCIINMPPRIRSCLIQDKAAGCSVYVCVCVWEEVGDSFIISVILPGLWKHTHSYVLLAPPPLSLSFPSFSTYPPLFNVISHWNNEQRGRSCICSSTHLWYDCTCSTLVPFLLTPKVRLSPSLSLQVVTSPLIHYREPGLILLTTWPTWMASRLIQCPGVYNEHQSHHCYAWRNLQQRRRQQQPSA